MASPRRLLVGLPVSCTTTSRGGQASAAAPRAQQYAAALAWPPRLVVVHDTGNPTSNRRGEANYAATRTDSRDRWTSAHAYIDNGGVLGSLPLDRQAWAAYSYANQRGWHLELCLTGDRAVTRRIAAGLTRTLCDLAGIPKVKLSPSEVAAGRRGVCGHLDITRGLKVGDHTDPGEGFPWSEFMSIVNGKDDDMSPEQEALLGRVERILTAMGTRLMPDAGPGETEDRTGIVLAQPWPGGPLVLPNPIDWMMTQLAKGGAVRIADDQLPALAKLVAAELRELRFVPEAPAT